MSDPFTKEATDPILLNTDVRRAIMGVEYMAKSFKDRVFLSYFIWKVTSIIVYVWNNLPQLIVYRK